MRPPIPSGSPDAAELDPRTPKVLGLLLDNHARFLRFLERRVGSRDDAEDILQEAFVRSVGRTDALASSESATAWFYRVLRNAIIDHHRREDARSRAFVRLAGESESDAAGADEELDSLACACVMALLDTLKPEYGTALRRIDLDGLSVRRFAEEVDITPDNAGVRVFRAREALKKRVTESCGVCAEPGCVNCTCTSP